MYGLIYKVTNIQNRKVYIGQTTTNFNNRKKAHELRALSKNRKRHEKFHDALKSYGIQNFKWEILGYCETKEELNEAEIECIDFFQSTNKLYGYNLTKGGLGCKATEETKQKISNSNKGKIGWCKGLTKETDERLRRISENSKNRIFSEETKRKMRETRKTRKPITEETREKMRVAGLGKKRPKSLESRQKLSKALTGKKRSKESIEKQKKTIMGENHPRLGKKHSEESKKKMSEIKKQKCTVKGRNNPKYKEITKELLILISQEFKKQEICQILNITPSTYTNKIKYIISEYQKYFITKD